MPVRVLLEKVRRPDAGGLGRPRLEQRLLGTDGVGLALVVAPAGSGKTTLLAQACRLSGLPAAWYTVGPEDGSSAAFVRHLAHALASVTSAVEPLTESLDDLIIGAQSADGPVLLVVDDLHEIGGTPAEVALERFVRLRPRTMTVLLGSRRTPAINTPRLLASGALVELGVDDLRFRSWEVEELYRRVYGEPLSPESAAALTRRTEGWAAGLQLFHLSTAGKERAEREAAVADLSGRSRLIRSYLTYNVIADLPAERRDFLMRTSTLGVLTGGLCDELLGTAGSAAVLAELERCHFFTTTSDEGSTFRYHQVLHGYLEVQLVEVLGPRRATELYARSAELLERNGYTQASLRAYARAEEWGSVARLVRQSRSGLALDDLVEVAGSASAALSREDPWIALCHARRLARQGRVRDAVAAFLQAEQLADDRSLRDDCATERALVAMWLPPDEAGGAGAPPVARPETAAAVIRTATVTVPRDMGSAVPSTLAEVVVHLLGGRFDRARDVLSRTAPATGQDGWEALALRLVTVLVGLVAGTARDPSRTLEEVALTADLAGQAWLAKMSRGVQACVLTAGAADPGWSGGSTEGVAACRAEGDAWGALLLGLVGGIGLVRGGRSAEGGRMLRDAAEGATALRAPVLALWASALAALSATGGAGTAGTVRDAERLAAWAADLGVTGIGACALLAPPPGHSGPPGTSSAHGPAARTVELSCLGGLRLRVADVDVDVGRLRPRARTLLQILAVHHGHDVHREQLIDVLWPEATIEVGAHRLHVGASSVRRLLTVNGCGEAPLVRRGDVYRLVLPGVLTDAERFETDLRSMSRAVAADANDEGLALGLRALAAYAGDLLPVAGPADWVLSERERLRVLASSAAIEVARLARDLGRLEEGRRAAQRAVELDPLRDSAWALLAEHQEALGEPSAAAATRREHERVVAVLEGPG